MPTEHQRRVLERKLRVLQQAAADLGRELTPRVERLFLSDVDFAEIEEAIGSMRVKPRPYIVVVGMPFLTGHAGQEREAFQLAEDGTVLALADFGPSGEPERWEHAAKMEKHDLPELQRAVREILTSEEER